MVLPSLQNYRNSPLILLCFKDKNLVYKVKKINIRGGYSKYFKDVITHVNLLEFISLSCYIKEL